MLAARELGSLFEVCPIRIRGVCQRVGVVIRLTIEAEDENTKLEHTTHHLARVNRATVYTFIVMFTLQKYTVNAGRARARLPLRDLSLNERRIGSTPFWQ